MFRWNNLVSGTIDVGRRIVAGSLLVPIHVCNLILGTKMRLWISMAVQAPAHRQGLSQVDFFHLVHATMATNTSHARVRVHLVAEVCVVGQLVDLDLLDASSLLRTLPYLGEFWTVRRNLFVAIHARCRGWNGCVISFLDCVVAVATVDAEVARMKLVAVGTGCSGS